MSVLKIAGINPLEIGLQVLRDSERPILPNTRDRTLVIPGRHGAWDFGSDLEPRNFNLDCAFMTRSPDELQASIETMAGLLVDERGRPKTVELIFSVHPERVFYVRYSGSMPITRLAGMGRFTLPLVAFDPFSYSIDNAAILLDSDIILDSDILLDGDYSFKVSGTTTSVIHNDGQAVFPEIEVVGSFTTFSIMANGKIFGYSEPLSGQTLKINENNRLTVKVGATNKMGSMTGDFIELLPGHNTVTISGTGLNCIVNIIFKNKYL